MYIYAQIWIKTFIMQIFITDEKKVNHALSIDYKTLSNVAKYA